MANPLNNETEIFNQLKQEKITLHPQVWDIIYSFVGDNVTAINLIISYYISINEEVPITEARKIMAHASCLKGVFLKIIHPEMIEISDKELSGLANNEITVPHIIKELFNHYIANDIQAIMSITYLSLDPLYECNLPIEDGEKILEHTSGIVHFMEKLRKVCS